GPYHRWHPIGHANLAKRRSARPRLQRELRDQRSAWPVPARDLDRRGLERDPEHQRARDRGHPTTRRRLLGARVRPRLQDRSTSGRLDGVIRRVLAIAAVVVTALLLQSTG